MYCNRCGEIALTRHCEKCGGLAAESTTGAAAVAADRKDPWSSTYLQRRLNPTNAIASPASASRPLSTAYLPSTSYGATDHNNKFGETSAQKLGARPLTGSPKSRYGISDVNSGPNASSIWASESSKFSNDLPVSRPRPIRDATGTRPASMYALSGVLDSPLQAAIERTVAPKTSRQQLLHSSPGHSPNSVGDPPRSPRLKSKWSQYFTSTASPQVSIAAANSSGIGRGRSESMSSAYASPTARGLGYAKPSPSTKKLEYGAPSSSAAIAVAAAGTEAASFAHTQLADQHERRISSGYKARANTTSTYASPINSSSTPNGAKNHLLSSSASTPLSRPFTSDGNSYNRSRDYSSAAEVAADSNRRYASPSAYISKTPAVQPPSSSLSESRNLSSAFENRKTSVSQRDSAFSARMGSPLMSANDILRSRSATLPELHTAPGQVRPCTACSKELRPEDQRQFASKPGILYCADCYHSSYSRGHCAGCNKIVLTHGRPWLQYGDKVWHKLCIKCRTCNKLLITPLVDLDGMPTCEPCFMKSNPSSKPHFMPKESSAPAHPLSSSADLQPLPQRSTQLGLGKPATSHTQLRSRIDSSPSPAINGSAAILNSHVRHRQVSSTSDMSSFSPYGYGQAENGKPMLRASYLPQSTTAAATSIPTPALTEYDRAPSDLGNLADAGDNGVSAIASNFNGMFITADPLDSMRIMSPVEVAEKEGLPLPRHIVDPDIGAISRSETQPSPSEIRHNHTQLSPVPAPRPTSGGSRKASGALPKIDTIKSMLSQSVTPINIDAHGGLRPPLSPSLKNPNSPTARTSSPRSVSFRIDEPPLSQSRIADTDNYQEESDYEAENDDPRYQNNMNEDYATQKQHDTAIADERNVVLEPAPPAKSLADYVLSKANTAKPKSRLPSVAETIKKFSTSAFLKDPGAKDGSVGKGSSAGKQYDTLDKSQLPELKDLLRTHQREPPKEPTIPALDKHSKILKSRPRNQNRRRPSQTPAAIQEGIAEANADHTASIRANGSYQHTHLAQDEQNRYDNNGGEADPYQFVPNQCARCANGIEDTWFRLSDGRQVHVECFTCQGCDNLIDDGVYVLENGIEFHPQCVPPAPPIVAVSPVPSSHSASSRTQSALKPRGPRAPRREETCDRCQAVLSGPRFQLTNGKQYHPECFACAGCGQRFDEGSYVCFEGQEFHHQCVEKFAAASSSGGAGAESDDTQLTCGECSQTIEGVFLRHNDAVFHPNCFCCIDCQRAITPGMPFGEIDARPCCEACLERRATAAAAQQQKQGGWANNRSYYPAAKTGY
ncbi:hypothetical protein GGI25_001735 [Coemansia spiralis]|uniref:LIM zinc-binding domain-containing protein n=2 Tax=Coemansia TaxID=4863 RepID=A0A9W8GAE6_9FUNG|nr:hypothetical protein BX070DRAFT_233114 [Coemansia spiralis]KAJ1991417.1 hypothetical protein EDC05_003487 [Coemansia umbellata]KAJ2624925.1 hypothetical protein GGI26_001037 [Coemansia sp. RSA 1358]KAJ2679167.1 hypothetical protein GGI25_001735 [Coemansia spiralis]